LPAVISVWPVMNTAISRATSSPGAAPRLTVQALRNR
jgi:anti-anti-sigma factor